MITHRTVPAACLLALFATHTGAPKAATEPAAPVAAARLSQPGPEEKRLESQAGRWNVTATMWPAAGAPPQVTKGLVAERKLIGNYLEEVMQPAPGSTAPKFQRIDYLNFDHVEGRWKYVSIDTRFPVSIMPAWSSGIGETAQIQLQFMPQAFVGFGSAVEGRFMLSDMVISDAEPEHMTKEQHAGMADGSGRSWLFVRYEYTRAH